MLLLVAISSVSLTALSPHRRDPFRHPRPITSPSPNPDSPKTPTRPPAYPSSTASQSASALIPPRTPSPTVPPRTLHSTSARPASHDLSTIWPRTPPYSAMSTAYHIHPQTSTCTSLTITPSHSNRKRIHLYWNRQLIHPLVFAHPPKHRTHTLRTPNRHTHLHLRVHSIPPLQTHTCTSTKISIPPDHIPNPPSPKKRNAIVHALLGNGRPVTRSQPSPPNPCSSDSLPNPPQPLKTPRTTPLPQSPGASIAHLRNHERTPPSPRPHPLAVTPITTHRPTPTSHTRTLTLYSPTAHYRPS